MMNQEHPGAVFDLTIASDWLGGDQSALREHVAMFVDSIPRRNIDLNTAMNTNNYEVAADIAHRMQTSFANLGATQALDAARVVEKRARSNHPCSLEPLDGELQAVVGSLEEWLALQAKFHS